MAQLTSATSPKHLIVGIGSALVDILIQETDDFLAQTGGQKGGMTLVPGADFMIPRLRGRQKSRLLFPAGRRAIPFWASAGSAARHAL